MEKAFRFSFCALAWTLFLSPLAIGQTISSVYFEPPNPQLTSTINPALEIAPTGQLNATAGFDGFQIDSENASITIDANNTNAGNNAILVASPGNGINILNGAGTNSNALITINSGSAITVIGTGVGILVDDTGATITNAGTVNGGSHAIEIAAGGTNTTILNTGILQGGTGSGVFVDGFVANGGSGLTLTNSEGGLILATGIADAIQLNQNFTTLTNNANSTISAVNGSAINIAPSALGPISGDIENFGTIQTSGTNQVVSITNPFNGSINNRAGGLILGTGNGANVIFVNDSFNAINNDAGATISATGSDFGINVTGNAPGTINNAGLIQTNAVSLLYNDNTVSTGFNNTGTITSTSGVFATILGRNNTTVDGIFVNGIGYGIVNNGIISNTGGAPAIDLQTSGNNINIPLLQQGGTIIGDVLLASGGGVVLTLTGGAIVGDVSSSNANASTLNLTGGAITGTTQLGNVNGNIVNLGGTNLQTLLGGTLSDTFNLSGGSFITLDGNGGADVINVTGPFTQNGTITQIPTINVLNGGIFTVNNTISADTTAFNINSGGAMITNVPNLNTPAANILINPGGSLRINNGSTFTALNATNRGTLTTNGGILSLGGNFLQNANGIYSPTILSPTLVGRIDATGTATFAPTSFMAPTVNTSLFIPVGTQFVVVTAGGGVIGAPTLLQPQSALVFFTQTVNPNDITLTLAIRSIGTVVQDEVAQGVGSALDALFLAGTTNPELLAVLAQLENLPDATTLTQALLVLAPPFNYALPTSTRIVMDNAFDNVQQRLEQLHNVGLYHSNERYRENRDYELYNGVNNGNYNEPFYPNIPRRSDERYRENRDYELYNGVNNGDLNLVLLGLNHFDAWVKVDGTIVDQHKRNQVEGFLAQSAGVAIGWDFRLTLQALIGLSLSDTKVDTRDNTAAGNTLDIQSYQATFYGWFEPMESIYLDAMLAVATHNYDAVRYIQIGSFTATASAEFLGTEFGAQVDLGYVYLTDDNWYIAPFGRFRYTYLDIGTYSETGAGGVGLSVINQPLEEMIAGIGLRIAVKKDYITAVYVPEASATLLYDFAGKVQEMQAAFLGFPVPFYVNSVKPAQLIQLYSLGITAYTTDNYSFTIKLNFEHREQLFGYNGYLQLNYRWG